MKHAVLNNLYDAMYDVPNMLHETCHMGHDVCMDY